MSPNGVMRPRYAKRPTFASTWMYDNSFALRRFEFSGRKIQRRFKDLGFWIGRNLRPFMIANASYSRCKFSWYFSPSFLFFYFSRFDEGSFDGDRSARGARIEKSDRWSTFRVSFSALNPDCFYPKKKERKKCECVESKQNLCRNSRSCPARVGRCQWSKKKVPLFLGLPMRSLSIRLLYR